VNLSPSFLLLHSSPLPALPPDSPAIWSSSLLRVPVHLLWSGGVATGASVWWCLALPLAGGGRVVRTSALEVPPPSRRGIFVVL
jgi:hypothetical protein